MRPELRWKFAKNESRDIEGPNNPGIANFTGDRETTVVREAIQNSLDALDGEGPVIVSLERKKLNSDLMATEDLLQHIEHSIESSHNDDENRSTFKNARDFLRGGGGIPSFCALRTSIQPALLT